MKSRISKQIEKFMVSEADENYESDEQDLEILVDVLRRCFGAEKARYYMPLHQNELYIEISGIQDLKPDEIIEISEPVLSEFDLGFDEIMILPLKN